MRLAGRWLAPDQSNSTRLTSSICSKFNRASSRPAPSSACPARPTPSNGRARVPASPSRHGSTRRACPAPRLRGTRVRTTAIRRAEVVLSFPLENIGAIAAEPAGAPSPATCSSCASSPACGCSTWTARRRSPPPIRARSSASQGTRRLAGVASGPLIGTIIKPSVGLIAGADRRRWCATLVDGGHRLHQGRRADGRPARTARSTQRVARGDARGQRRTPTAPARR